MSREEGSLPNAYPNLLAEIKQRLEAGRVGAALAVNRELIRLYWDIGQIIVQRQQTEGWGKAIVDRLSADLRRAFPDLTGLSSSNLWRMRSLYLAYAPELTATPPNLAQAVRDLSASEQVAQPVRELAHAAGEVSTSPMLPHVVAEIPWGHNIVLLEKLKDNQQRLWYAQQTTNNGWSRAVLVHQIESDLYGRQGSATTNFDRTLPAPQSDLANQLLKSPYALDFLGLADDVSERQLETALIDQIQSFLIELGRGFAFVGRQYEIEVGGQDYRLDLLFYHLHLRAFVVIDLKVEAFKPEFAGKMSFYLSAVDDLLRHEADHPTIGLLLCKEQNHIIVEYSLRDSSRPMGVATYQLVPENMKGELPSPEELQSQIGYVRVPNAEKHG